VKRNKGVEFLRCKNSKAICKANCPKSALAVCALLFTACSNPSGGTGPAVTSVTVSPGTAAVVRGGTAAFTAAVSGTGSPAQTVTWAVSGGGAGTAITPEGVLTVAAGETEGTTLTVTATSAVDPGKSGAVTVTVYAYEVFIHANGWGNGTTTLFTFTATSLTVVNLYATPNQTAVIDFSSVTPATDRELETDYKTGFTFTGTISSNDIDTGNYARDDSAAVVDNKAPGTAHVMTWYISNDGQSIITKSMGNTYAYTLTNAFTKQ
jgi:hypothetical protein